MKKLMNKLDRMLHKSFTSRGLVKLITLLFSVLLLLFLYKQGVVAPMFVNGEPITLSDIYLSYKQGGPENALDRAIAEKIVEYEARKRNIVVKKAELEAEMARIEKQAIENGKTLTQIASESNLTVDEYEKSVKTRLTIYKIVAQSVEIDDAEIDRVIEQNEWIYRDAQQQEQVREEVRQLLIERRIDEEYQQFIKDAKASSEIDYILDL